MNKKGFTLIELISSVVILVMIILIATPAISKMIDEAGLTTDKSAKERIIDAAKVYTSSVNRDTLKNLVELGDKNYIKSNTLIQHGLISKNTVDLFKEETVYVSVELKEDNKLKYEVEFDSSLVVENRPYIVILGDNPYFLTKGTTYTDPGSVSFDKDGNNISSAIETTGIVNTNQIGNYVIEYKVKDSQNIESEKVQRMVYVIDEVLPEVTTATMVSNNALNNKYAKNGDTITVNMTFSKKITNQPTVKIGGKTATVTGSGTTRTATYTIANNETQMATGELSISIENYKDIYTNSGIKFTNITTGGKVRYLTRGPIITYFYIGAANNPQYVPTNTTLYSNVSGAYQMCYSNTTTCSNWVNYAPTRAHTLSSGNGEKTVYAWYRDLAGNVSERVSDNVNADEEAPTIVNALAGTMRFRDPTFASGKNSFSVYNNSGNGKVVHARVSMTTPVGSYAMRITTNGAATPGLGGFVQITNSQANRVYMHRIIARIPVGYTIQRASNATGTGTTHTWITPQAGTGNWEEYIYITRAGSSGTFNTFGHVYLSGTAGTASKPVVWYVAYATIYDTQYWGRTGNIVFNATDAGTGIVGYGINTSSTTAPTFTSVSARSSFGIDMGNYTTNTTYYVWVKDAAGNIGKKAVTLNRVDRTAPTCTSSGGSATWTNGNRTITGTCSDTGGSGCVGNITKTYSSNTNTTTASPGTVYDNAGNSKACPANRTIKIDKTAPTCTSSGGSATWTNGNRTITGTCSDTGGSGCVGNITKTYSSNTNTTTASPGTVYDNAGNSKACPANRTIKIDKTAPTCTSSGGSATWTNGNRTITGTCSDTGGSGCVGNITKTYSSNTNTTTASPGTVYDNAGNSKACPANRTIKIDKTAPTCTSSGGSATWTNGNRTITGTCSDTGGSGCVGNITKTYSSNTNTTTASPGTVYDNAGNSKACPANRTIKIDKTAPTCTTSGGSTAWATSRTITGKCSDTGGSTCAGNVSKAYTTTTNTTASPGTVSDKAGNSKACPNTTVRVDKTAPAAFTNNTTGRTTSSISISATGASDAHSGLHSSPYAFSNNGGSTYTAYRAGNSYNFTGLAGGTTYSMRIRVRDALGNVRTGGAWNVTTLLTRVSNYAVTTSQMYRGSAGAVYNNYTTEQIQGTYDGTLTNTRNTLFWFNHATIRSNLSGSTINGVRLRVQRLNTSHGNAGAGILRIYTHNYSSVPGAWYGSGITHRADVSLTRGQATYVALPVAVGNGFRDNTIKGMSFFSNSTHQWNYYVRCPKSYTLLEITYTK